jgi:hypothetical protein
MSDPADGVKPPWYADKDLPVLLYRINRRPSDQQSLFAAGELPSFLDHLEEALLFGTPVVTGRSYQREWLLGNREINSDYRYLSGWIGYDTTGPGRRDYYDGSTKSWATELIEEQRTAKAPFAIAAETRILGVAKHPSFSSGTLAVVFEALLDGRENADLPAPAVDWAVEPLLDEPGFEQWLRETVLLERVTFSVKLPNPDAAESFAELSEHILKMDANLTHTLTPRDKRRGLSKDFQQEPISQGLLEMARRSYAQVTARGRSGLNRVRDYNQKDRVLKRRVKLPSSSLEAQRTLGEYTSRQPSPGGADGQST